LSQVVLTHALRQVSVSLIFDVRQKTNTVPPPSVSKQFKALVAPDLLALGFSAGSKTYWRVTGEVFQAVFIHTETRIRREFMIEYCTFLVCVPHAFHTLDLGGRFPVETQGTSYPADTLERLDSSMVRVRGDMPRLLEWFRSTETTDGYIRTYLHHIAKQPPRLVENGHTSFALACGYAVAGDFQAARPYAIRALSEFEGILASYRAVGPLGVHWAPEWIERAQSLVAAIDRRSVRALLEGWRGFTIGALKLDGCPPRNEN
jgi:hypothetical protein